MDRLDATRGRSPVPAPPRGFAPIVHTPGVSPRSSHQGGRHPGFRPGLWYTGPTARPGTGERPVGAPDHSQGRNPWAAKPWAGETPGRRGPFFILMSCVRLHLAFASGFLSVCEGKGLYVRRACQYVILRISSRPCTWPECSFYRRPIYCLSAPYASHGVLEIHEL